MLAPVIAANLMAVFAWLVAGLLSQPYATPRQLAPLLITLLVTMNIICVVVWLALGIATNAK